MALPTKEEYDKLPVSDKLITWSKLMFGLAGCLVLAIIAWELFKYAFSLFTK